MDVRKDAGSMNRAYALLELKAIDDETRTITGIASTPATDRTGDVVMPKGAQFKLPLPLLWQHDAGSPIGTVDRAKVTAAGIEIVATIAKNVSPDIDKAWALIKAGLVRGLSIGFRSIDSEQIPNSWGVVFKEWELLEVSAVTIPANAEATIQTVKSFDTNAPRSAQSVVRLSSPGASGKSMGDSVVRLSPKPPEGKSMNVQDQIKSFTTERAAKMAALDDILTKAEGASLDADTRAKYDDIEKQVDTIDEHLALLSRQEKRLASGAQPLRTVEGAAPTNEQIVVERRGGDGVVAVAKKLPPGIMFARFAKAMAMSNGNPREALEIVKEIYPEETPLQNVIKMHIGQAKSTQLMETVQKTAVPAATPASSTWAGALIQYQTMAEDFLEFLRPQTLLGKVPNLRRVPFKVRVPRQLTGGTAYWPGPGAAKPLTSFQFDTVTLDFTKIATIAVLTDEVVRLSSPNAETLVRDQLAAALIQKLDDDFINPDNAGVGTTQPASITHGVAGIASAGNTEANVRTDIVGLFGTWATDNINIAGGVWIMSANSAIALSMMVNALGQPSFPTISATGGTFFGLPVIVSENAGLTGGSDGGHIVVLVNPRDILLADDGTVAVDTSREASLEMSDAPSSTSATPTGASLVSMFQTNSVAVRAERWVNWTLGRTTAVQWLKSVNWGQP
jgi:HK97 family phage major capsid protein/HK97 family phage prohead protease